MPDKIFSSKNYLHDEVVLLQLIVDVYIKLLEVLSPIEKRTSQWHASDIHHMINEVKDPMIQIGGRAKKPPITIPWKPEVGMLERMEEFSYALALNTHSHNPTFLTLHRDIQETRQLAKNSVLVIELWEFQTAFFCETVNAKQMKQNVEDLCEQIRKISDSLSEALQFSSKKEHILLFLLRKHEKINQLIGPNFIVKTMKGLFPSGAESAKKKMMKTFAKKGFNEIQEEISLLFTQLDG